MSLTLQRSIYTITKRTRKGMRKKSHAFSDAIGQKPTLIIYTLNKPPRNNVKWVSFTDRKNRT